jgi:hypothetical protein
MKNTLFLAIAAICFSVTSSAQSTVDSIRAKYQLQPMPEALTLEKTFPVIGSYQLANATQSTTQSTSTTESTSTTPSTTSTEVQQADVTITLDSVNKGIIWVEGLPQGKFKAYLKKSPATYRILAQKTASGKQIPEGTLILDPSTNTLNIALGKAFDEADPAAIFAAVSPDVTEAEVKVKTKKSKTKSKVAFYTANKIVATPTTTTSVNTTTDQQQ